MTEEAPQIPKVLHRIWLDEPDGTPDVMPDEFVRFGHEWARLHPQWMLVEWRSRAALPELVHQDVFDRARALFPNDWKRFEADLLRLEILYRFGGVYVDCDVEPLRPLDTLVLPGVEAFVAPSANLNQGREVLTNAVMGSVPDHVFVAGCLSLVEDSIEKRAGKPLAQVIGPYLLDRVYRGSPMSGLHVYPSQAFYPQSNRDRDAGKLPDLSRSYTWHRWANSRDNRRGGLA